MRESAFTKHSSEAREDRIWSLSQNLAKYIEIWRPEHYILELVALLLFSAMALCWWMPLEGLDTTSHKTTF